MSIRFNLAIASPITLKVKVEEATTSSLKNGSLARLLHFTPRRQPIMNLHRTLQYHYRFSEVMPAHLRRSSITKNAEPATPFTQTANTVLQSVRSIGDRQECFQDGMNCCARIHGVVVVVRECTFRGLRLDLGERPSLGSGHSASKINTFCDVGLYLHFVNNNAQKPKNNYILLAYYT